MLLHSCLLYHFVHTWLCTFPCLFCIHYSILSLAALVTLFVMSISLALYLPFCLFATKFQVRNLNLIFLFFFFFWFPSPFFIWFACPLFALDFSNCFSALLCFVCVNYNYASTHSQLLYLLKRYIISNCIVSVFLT